MSRNVVEDIANLELRPTFLGIADNTALGEDVVRKLQRHKVNTEYMKEIPERYGKPMAWLSSITTVTWRAPFPSART